MTYELTRRDAVAALGAAGLALGTGALAGRSLEAEGFTDGDVATLAAVAEVVYPSSVTGVRPFVERYAAGRADARPEHAAAVRDAVRRLDRYARQWHDAPFDDLDVATREELLRSMGLDEARPDPDGADPGRLRYYLVNELLFALYATPTGAELVGLENPQGYPGGTTSYRRPPPDEER